MDRSGIPLLDLRIVRHGAGFTRTFAGEDPGALAVQISQCTLRRTAERNDHERS